jgi:hypothetical protein
VCHHVWTVVCKRAIQDSATRNYTLVEAIEQVGLVPPPEATFPITVPFEHDILTLWARSNPAEPETCRVRTRLLAPDGAELGKVEQTIDLSQHLRVRSRGTSAALTIAGEGWHEYEVSVESDDDDWSTVARVPLVIAFVPEEPAAGNTQHG